MIRSSRTAAAAVATLVIGTLLAGCGGGSVGTTPTAGGLSGLNSGLVTAPASGGFAPLPAINGLSGTILVPPSIGATSAVSASVTVSSAQPQNVPAPPLQALAFVSFNPTAAMNVPWYPQINATFPSGSIPAGAHLVWLYYRLPSVASPSSVHRQLVRERRGEWMTERALLAQSSGAAPVTTGYESGAASGGLSTGTLATITQGVVAVAAIEPAGSSSSLLTALTPINVALGATGSVTVTTTTAVTYTSTLRDCADATGKTAAGGAIATTAGGTVTAAAGASTTFSVTGVATGTCSLVVSSSAGFASASVVTVGAGAPIQAPSASSFSSPTPGVSITPTASPVASPAASPSSTPSPTPSPTPAPSSAPTAQATATQTISSNSFGEMPIPAIAGIDAPMSNISNIVASGAAGQTLTVAGSTANFASLPPVPGHTAFMYFTVGISAGTLTFDSGAGLTMTLTGSAFTAGHTYFVGYSKNGTVVQSSIMVTATANGAEGELDPATPFNNNSLAATDSIGIVVAQ